MPSLGATEKFQLGSALGLQAQSRDALTGALANTRRGASGFMLGDDALGRVSFEAARTFASPEDAAIASLRQKERQLRAPVDSFGTFAATNMFGVLGGLAANVQRSDAMLSAGEKEMIALLRDQIRILEESKVAQEKAAAVPNVGGTAAAARDLQLNREGR